jgi:hypothetical protein
MKSPWTTITAGLDQLFFSPMIEEESLDDRATTIDNFLAANGWTWDDVIQEMAKEDGRCLQTLTDRNVC